MQVDRITAVIFDLDGVVIDSEPARIRTYATLLESEYGIRPTIVEKDLIGKPEHQNIQYLLLLHGLKGDVNQLAKKRKEILLDVVPSQVSLISSVHSLLTHLYGQRIPCALATNSGTKYAKLMLKKFHLLSHFKVILTGEDVQHGKPHPEMFVKAAKKLGRNVSECLVVEDSPSGLSAAQEAGMKCLAILGSFEKKYLEGADEFLNRTEELSLRLLRKLGLPDVGKTA